MVIRHIKKRISTPVVRWYGRHERRISSISLIGGFIFDSITLNRVDAFWENVWILGHIISIVLVMTWINWLESHPGDEENPEKIHFWLVNALQFLFGGILSVFLVFYFRSADLSVSWPFILLLILTFAANELLKAKFIRLTFQVTLLFSSIYICLIFLLPVIIHRIGTDVFIYSGLLSIILIGLFISLLSRVSKDKYRKSRLSIYFYIISVFITVNILYFTNIIPPLPISIKDSGVYLYIGRSDSGDLVGRHEDLGWRSFFSVYKEVSQNNSDVIYAYSAVFSPTKFDMEIVHDWQHYNENTGEWFSRARIPLRVVGGRDGGFRTYSRLEKLDSGKWRVNVLTLGGQVIGRVRFQISTEHLGGENATETLE